MIAIGFLTYFPERRILEMGMISSQTLFQIFGIIFTIVGALHLLRLLTNFSVVLGGWVVPLWVSYFGVLLAWSLAYSAFFLSRKKK